MAPSGIARGLVGASPLHDGAVTAAKPSANLAFQSQFQILLNLAKSSQARPKKIKEHPCVSELSLFKRSVL
jgi:hypothetical protein